MIRSSGGSKTPYERLDAMGLELPPVPAAMANFRIYVRSGDFLFLSGQGPRDKNGILKTGTVGADFDVGEARSHAELAGLNLLAVANEALGDLGRVKQVVKILGLVNAIPTFVDHPEVIDGCSNLFVAVFGEAGRHARSAIGAGSLPRRITVEVEAIFEVE